MIAVGRRRTAGALKAIRAAVDGDDRAEARRHGLHRL